MILKSLNLFSQNIHKNRLLTKTILENSKNYDILFIQKPPWLIICQIPSSLSVICQVYLLVKYITTVILLSQHLLYKTAFHSGYLSHNTLLWQWCNYPSILSFLMGILLFDLVFYGRVILLSVSQHWNLCLR